MRGVATTLPNPQWLAPEGGRYGVRITSDGQTAPATVVHGPCAFERSESDSLTLSMAKLLVQNIKRGAM